jgi:hypothetical protein
MGYLKTIKDSHSNNGEVFTVNRIGKYVIAFDDASSKTIKTFVLADSYVYYYDQLVVFVKLYPKYDYARLLPKYEASLLGWFYNQNESDLYNVRKRITDYYDY